MGTLYPPEASALLAILEEVDHSLQRNVELNLETAPRRDEPAAMPPVLTRRVPSESPWDLYEKHKRDDEGTEPLPEEEFELAFTDPEAVPTDSASLLRLIFSPTVPVRAPLDRIGSESEVLRYLQEAAGRLGGSRFHVVDYGYIKSYTDGFTASGSLGDVKAAQFAGFVGKTDVAQRTPAIIEALKALRGGTTILVAVGELGATRTRFAVLYRPGGVLWVDDDDRSVPISGEVILLKRLGAEGVGALREMRIRLAVFFAQAVNGGAATITEDQARSYLKIDVAGKFRMIDAKDNKAAAGPDWKNIQHAALALMTEGAMEAASFGDDPDVEILEDFYETHLESEATLKALIATKLKRK